MLPLNNIITLLYNMKRYGTAIYGMGKNGKAAYDMLEQSGINVVAFTDLLGSKEYNGKKCIEWEVFNRLDSNTVILVTPKEGAEKITDCLKSRFTSVTDMKIIDWIDVFCAGRKGEFNW